MLSIHPTAEDVAEAAAQLVADLIAARSTISIGLAGGTTPSATYERLRQMDVDWDGVTLWLGDERWVPSDHPECNAHMVRRTLGTGSEQLIAPEHDLGDPERAAADYADRLGAAFAASAGTPDLVILGMGDDGHTASLFPDCDALDVVDRDYSATWVPHKETWRLTATFPLLWSADRLVFVVTGEAKADAVRRVIEEQEPLPAQRVAAGASDVLWILDEAAASQLTDR